jgi:hypothetical protein
LKPLARRRAIHELGQRAIDYYIDTGECVFCSADDVTGVPHADHCNVGELAGVEVTPERRAKKAHERAIVESFLVKGPA